MKYYSLLLFFVLLQLTSFAQNQKAIVHYYDYSIYVGEIIDENSTELTMLLTTGDTIVVSKRKIKRIHRDSETVILHDNGRMHSISGTFGMLSSGFSGGGEGSGYIDFVLGRRLNEKWAVGLGAGMSWNSILINTLWTTHNFVNAYGYSRYYLGKKRVRPFVYGRMGYGIPVDLAFADDHTGGFHAQTGIGFHFASRRKNTTTISLGQNIQYTRGGRIETDAFFQPVTYDYSIWYNRFTFTIGVDFK